MEHDHLFYEVDTSAAPFHEKLTEFLDALYENDRMSGYDCSVYRDGAEVYRRRVGYRDIEAGLPLTENTLYSLYSNTKVIACTAALQLCERGLLSLDDTLDKYYPEFCDVKVRRSDGGASRAVNKIKLHDIFSMTAGIGNGPDYADITAELMRETGGVCSSADLPRYIARAPLMYEPGTEYMYGIGHEILAGLISLISGRTFGEYLRENIFEPLGMVNTAFRIEDCATDEVAVQYERLEDGGRKRLRSHPDIPSTLRESASGGLLSTVDDYIKFEEGLRCCKLLSRETVDIMRRNKLTEAQYKFYGYPGLGYGLGVRTVLDPADPARIGEFGWGGAAGTLGMIDPERGLTMFFGRQVFGITDVQAKGELPAIISEGIEAREI